jgi:hypothetical protein
MGKQAAGTATSERDSLLATKLNVPDPLTPRGQRFSWTRACTIVVRKKDL